MSIEEILQEHPFYDTNIIKSSIADLIAETTGSDKIYTSPIKVSNTLPRWFIFIQSDVKTDKHINHTGLKELSIDIVYEQDFNLENLYDEYSEMADKIVYAVEHNLKYNVRDENEPYDILISIPLDAHDIKTFYDQTGMHCKFDLRLRTIDYNYVNSELIKKINWEVETKDGKE